MELDEADLIRNFLFMQVPAVGQAQFHEAHWKPYESLFEQVGRYEKVPPTEFYRDYLMRNGHYCRKKTAYVEFKRQNLESAFAPIDQVTELRRFATFELWLQRPELCEKEYLRERFSEIQRLDVTTAHPLLLHLLDRHERGYLGRDELDECVRDLASFVIRRTICGEQNRGYGRWFGEVIPTLGAHPSVDLQNYWLEKGWPDNAIFVSRLAEFPIYEGEKKKCRLFLERLERAEGHREAVSLETLTIEHVLPQTVEDDESGRAWKAMLGVAWKQEKEKWAHTLGNLTLTGYNPALGNNSFATKQTMFAQSNVSLNVYFGGVTHWNVDEIKKRGIALGRAIAELWPRPSGAPYVPPQPEPEDAFEEIIQLPPGPRRTTGTLRVMIRWSKLGIAEADETILEGTAGKTHAAFLSRLIKKYDPQLAERLQRVAVVRGYRLSSNPSRDFVNQKTGEPYPAERVMGTGLSLCTGTSNDDKRRGIQRLISELELPSGSVEVL